MAENIPNVRRHLDIQLNEADRSPNKFNSKIFFKTHCNKTVKNQRVNLKNKREESYNLHGSFHKADFSVGTLQARRDWDDIFKVLKQTKKLP